MKVYIKNPTRLEECKNYRGFDEITEKTDFFSFSFNLKSTGDDLWYSFDPNTCNFHIVKDIEETKAGSKDTIRGTYHSKLHTKLAGIFSISNRLSRGRAPWVKNHRWIEVRRHGFCYLLCLQSLYLEGKIISGDFDKIQFQAFPGYAKGCNYKDNDGKLIVNYPSPSPNGSKIDKENEIFVQNTKYDVGDDSNIVDVVDDFKNFITEVEHQTIIAIEKGIENEK
ncbi:MAG: hypothetical protein K5883_02740 [Pseudobutyrivibrio sp.]|nr:hypothetical protein [Pseudobutyrivibrio sp.]